MKLDEYESLYGWAKHIVETRLSGNCVYMTKAEIEGFRWATLAPGFCNAKKGPALLLGHYIIEVPAEMIEIKGKQ